MLNIYYKFVSKSQNRAFTLVELMVVIGIIAILSTIVIANIGQSKAKARDAKRVSDIAQIQLALAGFYDKCGEYPAGSEDADNDTYPDLYIETLNLDSFCYKDNSIVMRNFINRIPTDPLTNKRYLYVVALGPQYWQDYHLAAHMETQNQALKDRAGFDSSTLINLGFIVYGFDEDDNVITGIDAVSDPLIYDVRPGL